MRERIDETSPRWHRGDTGPVLAGDLVGGREVAGFGYAVGPEPVTATNDRLLLDGDQSLTGLPDRVAPTSAVGAVMCGLLPPARLNTAQVLRADAVEPELPARAEALLERPGAPWSDLAGPLITRLRSVGHEVWLSGGAARDLCAGAELDEVNDLDLSGTAPPGRFTELTREVLRLTGLGECEQGVSPERLVCWVRTPATHDRLVEYRSLALEGFRFPGTGSDMIVDAEMRDFTLNALYYDPDRHLVVDPTGRGLRDLTGPQRRLVPPTPTASPRQLAETIIRALKFLLRWADMAGTDDPETLRWVKNLPTDLGSQLSRGDWRALARMHQQYAGGASAEVQRKVLSPLGPVATGLIDELLRRSQ
jgi:poly(A) polymerase